MKPERSTVSGLFSVLLRFAIVGATGNAVVIAVLRRSSRVAIFVAVDRLDDRTCSNRMKATRHGLSHVPEYRIWAEMIQRCTNPKNKHFQLYGGRGITVCQSWLDSFQSFINDLGRRPSPDDTIERIDNDGNYEPENCRWATLDEQLRNTRCNRWIILDGRTQILADWLRERNILSATFHKRKARGLSDQEALRLS